MKFCRLSQLDLTYNNVGPDGALSLAFSLTRNDTLRRLVLRHNLIRDAGCQSFAHALASCNSSLTELSLAANGITDVGGRALATMLASNATLCRLDVSANVFGEVLYGAMYRHKRGLFRHVMSVRPSVRKGKGKRLRSRHLL